MKKIVQFTFLLLAILTSASSFSQGGNTCSSAASSPITLPFSATGTTCSPATDSYQIGYMNCLDTNTTYSTWGPDWLYYFCADSSGQINISLTNIGGPCGDPSQPYFYGSVSVWTSCPSSGNCVTGGFSYCNQTTYGTTPEIGNSFYASAGTCYYIMVSDLSTSNGGWCDCMNYHIAISFNHEDSLENACTNMGFDDSTFNGWTGTWGYTVTRGMPSSPTASFTPTHFDLTQQHTITTNGTDPIGGFPKVCPGFGPHSMMLGDGAIGGYGGATLEQKFEVTSENAILNYRYALVLQDGNSNNNYLYHSHQDQAFFKVEVFDCNGDTIPCGQYLRIADSSLLHDFTYTGSSGIYYKAWTPAYIDLTSYIGTCATVRFTAADCSDGGHFGYAYLDMSCEPIGPMSVTYGDSITLTAPAGAASYIWSVDSSTTQSITIIPTGLTGDTMVYTCSLVSSLSDSCVTTLNYTVTIDPPAYDTSGTYSCAPFTFDAVLSSLSCPGTCDGSIQISNIQGGTPGYNLSWSDGSNGINHTNLCSGHISLLITDGNSNACTTTFTITDPPAMNVTINSVDVSCNGGSDGSVCATVTGGSSPYTYLWEPGTMSQLCPSNLPAGNYTFCVTDANGCVVCSSASVSEPPPISISFSVTNVSCYGGNDGSVCPTVSGGTPPYSYLWPNGSNTLCQSYLVAGTYTLCVTDTKGCMRCVAVTITQPPPITISFNATPVSCNGGSDGTVCGVVSGGTPGYTYLWTPIAFTAPCPFNLPAGSYTLCAGDANGCQNCDVIGITEPPPITVTDSVIGVSCPTCCDGAIQVNASGGTGAYIYSFSPNGPDNLCPGPLSYTVTDVNGCTYNDSTTIPGTTSIRSDYGDEDLFIYPNPTNGILYIQNIKSNCEIYIHDLPGRLVFYKQLSSDEKSIDINELSKGVYFLSIMQDGQLQGLKRIVKE